MILKVFWISHAHIITHTYIYKTAVFYTHWFLGNEVIVVFVIEYFLVP